MSHEHPSAVLLARTEAIMQAQSFDRRYRVAEALDLTTDLDREGVIRALASSYVRNSIRAINLRINSPQNFIEDWLKGRDTDRLVESLKIQELVADSIDRSIDVYRRKYPVGSSRPHHIQYAVNDIVTQAGLDENYRVTRWGRRRRVRELAADWRARLAGSR
jgi:hypothetical protein